MSATYPLRKTAAKPRAAASSRPRLVVISSTKHKVARGPFIVLVSALLVGGLLALLMLHTLAAQDAFRQTTLQQRLATLTDNQQQLEQQVQLDSAPAALEARARALGMVPSTITSYHRAANGRTIARELPTSQVATTDTTPTTASITEPTTQPATQHSQDPQPKASTRP
jgi:cell division protein FtsB